MRGAQKLRRPAHAASRAIIISGLLARALPNAAALNVLENLKHYILQPPAFALHTYNHVPTLERFSQEKCRVIM
jgi:hypothetical protein